MFQKLEVIYVKLVSNLVEVVARVKQQEEEVLEALMVQDVAGSFGHSGEGVLQLLVSRPKLGFEEQAGE